MTPQAPPAREPPPSGTGLAPLQQALLDLQQRVEELERNPQAVTPEIRQRFEDLKERALGLPAATPIGPPVVLLAPPAVHPAAQTTPIAPPAAPVGPPALPIAAQAAPGAAPVVVAAPPLPRAALAPVQGVSQRVKDVPITVEASIEMDPALDGRARRRKVIWLFLLVLILVFGGLLASMAYSYSPQSKFLSQ
jgi:hypothetical protein